VGLDEQLDGLRARQTVRLDGACLVPGFNDAHCHTVLFGLSLAEVDVSDRACRTLGDIYQAIAEKAARTPEGALIVGTGYDQNKLASHPTRGELDRVAPRNPVWLKHTSAHMGVGNSLLLERIGVLAGQAEVPEGGRVDVASGLIQEQAQRLVFGLVWPYPRDVLVEAIARAGEVYAREGVTSCTEAGIGGGWIGHSPVELAAYMTAREAGRLPMRMTLMVASDCLHPLPAARSDVEQFGLDLGLRSSFGDSRLRLGAMKIFTDGSLLGRTAVMCQDFHGEPGNRGYFQADPDALKQLIVAAHQAGWQVAAHAIGDGAIDLALDAYAEAAARFPRAGTRHRIEHAGVARDDQVARMAQLSVLPVPQGRFISGLGDGMAAAVGPERVDWCYRMRSFLDAGLVVPGSSDRPVVPGAPLEGIHDLVNRRTATGQAFGAAEAVDAATALRAFTMGSAYAAFEEHLKGSVTPGKLADLVVLGDDPTACDPARIREIEVITTIVEGQPVFGGDRLGWAAET
jgi:predicted amidohydrolase YtcJ